MTAQAPFLIVHSKTCNSDAAEHSVVDHSYKIIHTVTAHLNGVAAKMNNVGTGRVIFANQSCAESFNNKEANCSYICSISHGTEREREIHEIFGTH